jgi:hypothetical protein
MQIFDSMQSLSLRCLRQGRGLLYYCAMAGGLRPSACGWVGS